MASKLPKRLQHLADLQILPTFKLVAVVPNFWGAGDTVAEAIENLREAGGGRHVARGELVLFLAPASFRIDPIDGMLHWPEGDPAAEILADFRFKKEGRSHGK